MGIDAIKLKQVFAQIRNKTIRLNFFYKTSNKILKYYLLYFLIIQYFAII